MSDVDVTNFPPIDCSKELYSDIACYRWKRHPGFGIAGIEQGGGKIYVQVKAPLGAEDPAVAAAQEEIIKINPKELNEDNVVIIPVKYDYGELWRWKEILKRFALSSGNTVGIVGSRIWLNHRGGHTDAVVLVPEAVACEEWHGALDRSTMRRTIHVATLDVQGTIDALPRLLPQLGIPVDAVGVVTRVVEEPVGRSVPNVSQPAIAPLPPTASPDKLRAASRPELLTPTPPTPAQASDRYVYNAVRILGVDVKLPRKWPWPTEWIAGAGVAVLGPIVLTVAIARRRRAKTA